jgi:hypothetical protein
MTMLYDGTNGVTFPDASQQNTAATGFGFKNRIFNGAMIINQRNSTVTVNTGTPVYSLDRWCGQGTASAGVFTFRYTSNAPAGFNGAIYAEVTTADASLAATDIYAIQQRIEGRNVADLNWGTANAATVTLSFYVRSNLTGTFGGSITNSAYDRSYPFSYTISVANTYERKTVTIPGDTTGTWLTDTGTGMRVYFGLGVGSSNSGTAGAWAAAGDASATGATNVMATVGNNFYLSGVQLEKGLTATNFDFRPYNTELFLCQRYFQKTTGGYSLFFYSSAATSSNYVMAVTQLPVTMRVAPSVTIYNGTTANQCISMVNTASFNGNAVTPYGYGTFSSPTTVYVNLYGVSTYGVRSDYEADAEL